MSIEQLYLSALKGGSEAEKALFEQLSVRFSLICHHRIWNQQDAEEIAQEALMTVLKGFRDIEIERSFTAWTHKILDNKILTYLKAKKASSKRQGEVDPESVPNDSHVTNPHVRAALLNCLREISKANNRYARALNFHYQGYTTAEICERLSLKPGHFYVLLMRARDMLENCLKSRPSI